MDAHSRFALALAFMCSLANTSNDADQVRVSLQKTIGKAQRLHYEALRNLRMTQRLRAQLDATKGKGRGKRKARCLRSWWDMSPSEQWWLEQLRTGQLHKQLAEAKEKYTSLVRADRIAVQRLQVTSSHVIECEGMQSPPKSASEPLAF